MATIFKKTKKTHDEIYKNLTVTEKRHEQLYDAWVKVNKECNSWLETFKKLEKTEKPTSAEWMLIGFWSGRKYEQIKTEHIMLEGLEGILNGVKIKVKRRSFLDKILGR